VLSVLGKSQNLRLILKKEEAISAYLLFSKTPLNLPANAGINPSKPL
jgi:hypothetical protein